MTMKDSELFDEELNSIAEEKFKSAFTPSDKKEIHDEMYAVLQENMPAIVESIAQMFLRWRMIWAYKEGFRDGVDYAKANANGDKTSDS